LKLKQLLLKDNLDKPQASPLFDLEPSLLLA
jgi:hypothetical protein